MNASPVVVIGAGICGLMAAHALQKRNIPTIILEKSNALGGRMATRRLGSSVQDHGAQYFTARTPEFQAQIKDWEAKQLVAVWFEKKQEPCYRVPGGMTTLAKKLAEGLTIQKNAKVLKITPEPSAGWRILLDAHEPREGVLHADGKELAGEIKMASGIISTAPLPQSLDILKESGISLDTKLQNQLAEIAYDPCVVLLLTMDKPPGNIGSTGFFAPGNGGKIASISDNQQKGISPNECGVTVQLSPEASLSCFEKTDQQCLDFIMPFISPYFAGANILAWQIKRWRYAQVRQARTTLCERVAPADGTSFPPLMLAGDAFAGPRVEGAVLSGWKAAEEMALALEKQGVLQQGVLR